MKSSQWDKVKLPYCEQEHECLTLRAQGQKSEDGKMYVYNVSKMSLFLRMQHISFAYGQANAV